MLFCFFAALSFCSADPAPLAIPWDTGSQQDHFATCLCRDLQGRYWVGTKGKGLWRYTPSAGGGQWTQFRGKDDFSQDGCYAVVCDAENRVWAGGPHGLVVCASEHWRRFTPLDGPLGGRIFALATSPDNNDVWGATESGLFRYSLSTNAWSYVTHADGLPSDAVQTLCFKGDTLLIGTQADGLAMSSASSNYHDWTLIPGPAALPALPKGDGLPSALINCLLVSHDGTLYAGTDGGLAISGDVGRTWHYLRGEEWWRKAAGVKRPSLRVSMGGKLLTEDYVQSLAEDGAGHLWIGHRMTGWEERDAKTGLRLAQGPKPDDIFALLPVSAPSGGRGILAAGYGDGLQCLPDAAGALPSSAVSWLNTPGALHSVLPLPAKPPTLSDLNAMLAEVGKVPAEADPTAPLVLALDDDWQTQGAWQGRYGRYWACLCALFHPIPLDYLWGAGWEPVDYDLSMGLGHTPTDRLRYWSQWRYTSNTGSLELPPTYLHSRVLKGYTSWAKDRRETEVDDHGENYLMNQTGPGIDVTVSIPAGLYYLSLYEFNYNGSSRARWRDYRLSVRTHVGMGMDDNSSFDAQPELAHGRVVNFCDGVWKRFLVRGPQTLTVQVDRNHSFNTLLPGVMLDLADEEPAPYFQTTAQWQARQASQETQRQAWASETAEAHAARFAPATTEREAAGRLFDALESLKLTNPGWWAQNGRCFYGALLRWYTPPYNQPKVHPSALLATRFGTCALETGLLPEWEASQQMRGLKTARDVEKSLQWDQITQSCSGQGYQIVAAKVLGLTTSTTASGKEGDANKTKQVVQDKKT